MTDIRAFIEDQIADDERIALATTAPEWSAAHGGTPRGSGVYVTKGSIIAEIRSAVEPFSHDAEHMARHDPARALREVEAKRDVLFRHVTYAERVARNCDLDLLDTPDRFGCDGCGYTDRSPNSPTLDDCPELRALASIWAGDADFRQEWEL